MLGEFISAIDATCLAIVILIIVVLLLIARQTNKWEVLGVIVAVISIWLTVKHVLGVDIFEVAWNYISHLIPQMAGEGFKEVMHHGK